MNQVIRRAKTHAKETQQPQRVYRNQDQLLQVSPANWEQALLNLVPDPSSENTLGYVFPCGRFEGLYF